MGPTFSEAFVAEAAEILSQLDTSAIESAARLIAETRDHCGRMFILGVGGSAANASHAVNDFRKIAGIEAYAPTDNVAELTARANDEGWRSIFDGWLRISRLRPGDLLLIFSVGGGSVEKNISPNLVAALDFATSVGAKIIGVVGRDGGRTAQVADICIMIPTVNPAHITPQTEAFQAIVWHLLVSHPRVKVSPTKWESASVEPSGKRATLAVFLDRDGVINRAFVRDGKPMAPPSTQALEILPGVLPALQELKAAGYKLIVVTNQPDVARGNLSSRVLDKMHEDLMAQLPLDEIFVCRHSDENHCACRKPLPGMLIEAAEKHHVDLARSFMIGDRWRDIDAGYAAGCKTILIDNHYLEQSPQRPPDIRVQSLDEAAKMILAKYRSPPAPSVNFPKTSERPASSTKGALSR